MNKKPVPGKPVGEPSEDPGMANNPAVSSDAVAAPNVHDPDASEIGGEVSRTHQEPTAEPHPEFILIRGGKATHSVSGPVRPDGKRGTT